MSNAKGNSSTRNHKYRVDITNDDTYSHVMTFHVSSKIFVATLVAFSLIIVLFTMSVIFFSPLKHYLPGIGYNSRQEELRVMKNKVDSLQIKVEMQDKLYSILQTIIIDNLEGIEKYDSLFFDNYSDASIDSVWKNKSKP